jgi:hypothetical protein
LYKDSSFKIIANEPILPSFKIALDDQNDNNIKANSDIFSRNFQKQID